MQTKVSRVDLVIRTNRYRRVIRLILQDHGRTRCDRPGQRATLYRSIASISGTNHINACFLRGTQLLGARTRFVGPCTSGLQRTQSPVDAV